MYLSYAEHVIVLVLFGLETIIKVTLILCGVKFILIIFHYCCGIGLTSVENGKLCCGLFLLNGCRGCLSRL